MKGPNGIKVCKARSAQGWRCTKPVYHVLHDLDVVHQNGAWIWRDAKFDLGAATATPEQQLTEWWMQAAEDEIARTVPKAVEYSATDLMDIGHDMARTAGREVTDEEAAELGVFFYLRGKVARWVGAIIAGKRVSDDTLFDIGVYVRMVQRIRDKGSWPGTEEPEPHDEEPFDDGLCECPGCVAERTPKMATGGVVPDYSNRSAG